MQSATPICVSITVICRNCGLNLYFVFKVRFQHCSYYFIFDAIFANDVLSFSMVTDHCCLFSCIQSGNVMPDDKPHENLELWNPNSGELVHRWVQKKQFDWFVSLCTFPSI